MLKSQEMINAIYDNDKNYDGIFYYGISTSKIYCNPSCDAKIPRQKNIVLFHSKTEAEEKGFTACPKCRPNIEWSQGIYETPLGTIKISEKDNFITGISFCQIKNIEYVNPNKLTDEAAAQFIEYVKGQRKNFDLPIKLEGTDFQKHVWEALRKIPYGEVSTYVDIASTVGSPRASRAIGKANNKNPILVVVPCHRVVGANSSLTGYAAGIEIKQKLLEIENNNRNI